MQFLTGHTTMMRAASITAMPRPVIPIRVMATWRLSTLAPKLPGALELEAGHGSWPILRTGFFPAKALATTLRTHRSPTVSSPQPSRDSQMIGRSEAGTQYLARCQRTTVVCAHLATTQCTRRAQSFSASAETTATALRERSMKARWFLAIHLLPPRTRCRLTL